MNKLKLLALFISCTFSLIAQDGIEFHKGTWADVLADAKSKDKLVFVDAYTTWCGPCKWMAKNTFPDQEVGAYYNSKFVNAKIDMEKGEGIDIAKKFAIRAYPTLLFVDGDGELVHRSVGSKDVKALLALGLDALNPAKQVGVMARRYESGDREPAFLKNFATAATAARLPEAKEVSNTYLATQEDLTTEEHLRLIFGNTTATQDPYFDFLVKNQAKFATLIGDEEYVINRIKDIIAMPLYRQEAVDFKKVQTAFEGVFSKTEAAAMAAEFKMNYYKRSKIEGADAKYFQATIDYMEAYGTESWSKLNGIAWTFYKKTTDVALLKKACKWAKQSVKINNNRYNNDTAAHICHALGKTKRARKYAETSIAIAKESGDDASDTVDLLKKINDAS